MNQAASARPEGIACDAGHTSEKVSVPPAKQVLANIWLLAARQVLETLGYPGHGTNPGELLLYVTTEGALITLPPGINPPKGTVYVCQLRPGVDVVIVAARLRHVSSRWRLEHPARTEDND